MKQNRNLLAAGAVILVCLVVAALATSIPGKERTYEVEAITSPEYKTDAARAIDAYERLMDRYMDLSEKLLSQMAATVRQFRQSWIRWIHGLPSFRPD